MAVDLKDIIQTMESRYPRWLVEGLSQSPEIRAMQTALTEMAKAYGVKTTGTKNDPLKQMDAVIKKTGSAFDNAINKNKQQEKTVDSVLRSFSGVSNLFSKSTTGFASSLLKMAGPMGRVASFAGEFLEVLTENSTAYTKVFQSGYLASNSLTGFSESAIRANLSFDQFVDVIIRNTSVLAVWGKNGQNDLASMIHTIRNTSDRMGRFGFSVGEVNDFVSDYLSIQQKQGILNKKTTAEQLSSTAKFIDDIAEYSTVLGYSRQTILDSVKKSAEDPSWALFTRSRIESEKGLSDGFNKAATIVNTMAGPEYGEKIMGLVQDLVVFGSAVTPAAQDTLSTLTAMAPEMLVEVDSLAKSIKNQRILSEDSGKIANKFARGMNTFSDESMVQQALIQRGIGQNSETLQVMMEGNLAYANFQDKLTQEGYKSVDEYMTHNEKVRIENAKTQQGYFLFNEMVMEISNAFKSVFVGLIEEYAGGIKGISLTIKKYVQPALLEFSNYMKNMFSPEGRDKIFSDLSDMVSEVIGDAIADGFYMLNPLNTQQDLESRREERRTTRSLQKEIKSAMTGDIGKDVDFSNTYYDNYMDQMAKKYNISESLLKSMIHTESGAKNVVSPKGAIGLAQFMPNTAAEMGINPYDPKQSIEGGAKYLSQLLQKYKDTEDPTAYALAAYNWGMGNVDRKGLGQMPSETRRHIAKVKAGSIYYMDKSLNPSTTSSQSYNSMLSTSENPNAQFLGNDTNIVALLQEQNAYLKMSNDKLDNLSFKFSDNNMAMKRLTNTVQEGSPFF